RHRAVAELLKQLGGNRRQLYRWGLGFARHIFSWGASYALNTKLLTDPRQPQRRHAMGARLAPPLCIAHRFKSHSLNAFLSRKPGNRSDSIAQSDLRCFSRR
ncbi:MAG TPA: hypothetical protein VHC91_15090, partial [Trinickia sp.]|uniref:hypothetical protein n=1 Tax=Trinickia sp. TaxID=2571163 RepID=UPI002D002A04